MIKRRQLGEFYDRGFTVVPHVFAEREVGEMLAAFDRLEKKARDLGESCTYRGSQFVIDTTGNGRVAIQRIVWCGAAEPVLSDYGRDPRLLKMAGLLLGSWEMHQLINQAHFKLPGDGVAFPWHQDSTHHPSGGSDWKDVNGSGSYVQSVVALDEISELNGPLELIPGSCRPGHVAPGADREVPVEAFDESRAKAVTMTPGAVALFGPDTLHRGSARGSERRGRVFINGFACPGANRRSHTGDGTGRLVRVSRNGRR